MLRFLQNVIKLIMASGLLAGVIYVCSDTFGKSWRSFVIQELAARGLHLDFSRLTLNPLGGIIAQKVQVFADADRKQVLVAMDHLNLDFDLGQLFEKKFVLEALELSHTNVTLPIDPESDEPTVIEIEDLSARAFLSDGRLEIQEAEGTLSGIVLSLSGELLLPARAPETVQPVESKATPMQRIEGLRQHQVRIRRGLDWLKRFQFAKAPRINLELHGSMDRLTEMNAHLFFEANGLSYESYTCEELRAELDYNAGFVDLTRFHLQDRLGELNASATWRMGADDLRFHLTSSADLPSLAEAFLNSDNMREIVFYEPPNLALEGVWHIGGPFSSHRRPVKVTGQLECGRFSTRGTVFEGVKASIGVAPQGVYIRDLVLRHQTGTLAAQTMVHEKDGCRYQIVARMDPNAFVPFAKMQKTREIIQRFQFTPESSIHFELNGVGPEPDPQKCLNTGRGDLRHFKYKGVELDELQADVEFQGPVQHYRNLKIKRPEGDGEAVHVHVNDQDGEKWVILDGVKSNLDPVAIVGVFAPKTADIISRYRLPNTTSAEVDGTVHYRVPDKNDLRVKFRHATGTGRYVLFGEDYLISSPKGDLTFKGPKMNFEVSGQVHGGPMLAKGTVDLRPESGDFDVILKAARFPYEAFGKKLPFENLLADVRDAGKGTKFDITSNLLGGDFTLNGVVGAGGRSQDYSGDIDLKAVSLLKFAQIYSKNNDTEGDMTGHFKFTGKLTDWQALKGGGALTILNGNLYSVPLVGVLAPLLGTVLPKQIAGYNVAKEADCTFKVADGFVMTEDFEALTSTFKILLSGRIDFIRDVVDLVAQVRVRGLPGIVFLPFSELLQYHGDGSFSEPMWTAMMLKGGSVNSKQAREAPTEEAKREAERISQDPAKALVPLLKKIVPQMFNRPGGR
ncbi:MAG: hypothetical protein NTV80_06680 [Verrucomicrobia bacterium]|nr:hypothetical protein [Verrucomicrobiota bacterium]